MLVGPKGSGKTYIGSLIGKMTDIVFLKVEPVWLKCKPNENGWKKVEDEIDRSFESCNSLMVESLGAGAEFQKFFLSLKAKYDVRMVRVYADPDACLNRVRTRCNSDHIAVSDDKVEKYNRIASQVEFDWALEIDNNGPASPAEILKAFKNL